MTHSFPTRRSSDLCTPPANYYHVLRRQMLRPFRKPLVIVTPKSLLRHKAAVSELADFAGDSHFRRILSDPNAPADDKVERLVLCTGDRKSTRLTYSH